MKNNISPLNGRYISQLSDLSDMVSEFALARYRVFVEISWFKYLFIIGLNNIPPLSELEISYIDNIYHNFTEDDYTEILKIEMGIKHDVKAVEYYIKNKLLTSSYDRLKHYAEFVHFGCTSDDINNLSYALMMLDLKKILLKELNKLNNYIYQLSVSWQNIAMVSRTHGQKATPTTMGKEIYNTYYRLQRQIRHFTHQEILGKINGAIGGFNAHIICYPLLPWSNLAKNFVEKLGLTYNPYTTQIEPHDYLSEIFDNLKRINTILLDFSRDIWFYMALNYFKHLHLDNEVGSSTMPHKINPIQFENAEGNLGIANALLNHLSEKLPISRLQRDLSDSTVMRNIGVAIAHSILAYRSLYSGLTKLAIDTIAINNDLSDCWEVLTEAVQTMMRKHHMQQPYEQLKRLARGQGVTRDSLHEFIKSLQLPVHDEEILLNLTPNTYLGITRDFL